MSPRELLQTTAHRSWPLPKTPWIMLQVWHNLLFAHWPVPAATLRSLVPIALTVDTFEGNAWVGITPFRLELRPRGIPIFLSKFEELNCRTYVVTNNKPGIFFFSLDAASRLAVLAARKLYLLPYFSAQMSAQDDLDGISYLSRRSEGRACFEGTYDPKGSVREAQRGTLKYWLTERCLYTHSQGHLYRGEIHHRQWPLQDATCDIRQNSIASAAGISLPLIPPLCHFSRRLDVLIWPLQRVPEIHAIV
jgi:uncharacterized protein